MEIAFNNKKLEKESNDDVLLVRKHGKKRARLIMRRLTQLRAANCLSDLGPPYQGQGRCHELHGNRKGQFSIDLDHPYRLLFQPGHNPVPQREEGGIDWLQITVIEILSIEDTHE